MALLGSSIDPRLFIQDYSGFANAGAIQSQGLMNAANQISGAVADYGKQQKESKNALKSSQAQIDAAIKLFPDQAEYLSQISNELKNEDVPLSERASVASGVAEMIAMGVGQKRYETENQFREREMGLRERESTIRQHAAALDLRQAEGQMAQSAMDEKTKQTIGAPLLESVLAMSSPGISAGVKEKLAKGEYSDAEKYSLANSMMALIPKSEKKNAPTVQDVPVPGGTMKMQWDANSEKWTPMDTTIAPVEGFDVAKLPEGLQPHAGAFAAAGAKYGVDPKVLAAISMHETANGKSSAFRNKNNAMGISDATGPIDTGTVDASIDKMARLLAAGQRGEGPYAGKTTIAEIAGTYAPVGAGNDPRGLNSSWASGVSGALQKLGGNPAAPIGFTPTPADPAKQIQLEKHQAEMQQATVAKAGSIAKSKELIDTLDRLEKHEGFNALFGASIPFEKNIPGTDAADAYTTFKQIEGKGFIEAIQDMKGMGALSNAEGEKASAAFLGLSPNMSEKAAKAQIKIIKDLVIAGMQRAQQIQGASAAQTPAQDPMEAASSRLRGLIKPSI